MADPAASVPALDDSAALALMLALAGAGTGAGGELSYGALKTELRSAITKDPFDATIVTVLGGSFLFYVAEKGHNPKVETYWDALVFISTCLSVGYADIFARTPAGKAIASAVMTFGPAMSGALLEGPKAEIEPQANPKPESPNELLAVQRVIVDKLEAILDELKAGRAAAK